MIKNMIILSVIIAEIGFVGFFTFIYLAYKAYAKGDFPSFYVIPAIFCVVVILFAILHVKELRDNERFELYFQQIEYKS